MLKLFKCAHINVYFAFALAPMTSTAVKKVVRKVERILRRLRDVTRCRQAKLLLALFVEFERILTDSSLPKHFSVYIGLGKIGYLN